MVRNYSPRIRQVSHNLHVTSAPMPQEDSQKLTFPALHHLVHGSLNKRNFWKTALLQSAQRQWPPLAHFMPIKLIMMKWWVIMGVKIVIESFQNLYIFLSFVWSSSHPPKERRITCSTLRAVFLWLHCFHRIAPQNQIFLHSVCARNGISVIVCRRRTSLICLSHSLCTGVCHDYASRYVALQINPTYVCCSSGCACMRSLQLWCLSAPRMFRCAGDGDCYHPQHLFQAYVWRRFLWAQLCSQRLNKIWSQSLVMVLSEKEHAKTRPGRMIVSSHPGLWDDEEQWPRTTSLRKLPHPKEDNGLHFSSQS